MVIFCDRGFLLKHVSLQDKHQSPHARAHSGGEGGELSGWNSPSSGCSSLVWPVTSINTLNNPRLSTVRGDKWMTKFYPILSKSIWFFSRRIYRWERMLQNPRSQPKSSFGSAQLLPVKARNSSPLPPLFLSHYHPEPQMQRFELGCGNVSPQKAQRGLRRAEGAVPLPNHWSLVGRGSPRSVIFLFLLLKWNLKKSPILLGAWPARNLLVRADYKASSNSFNGIITKMSKQKWKWD